VGGEDIPAEPVVKLIPCHKKNPDLGTKQVYYSNEIYVEQEDALTFKEDEEVICFNICSDLDNFDGLGKRHHP
jgi:hypothetical protein